jgi:hypothetical protein
MLKMKQNYKKSILGLNTVKAFIVILLSLAIIAIVTLVVLGSLNTPSILATTGLAISGSVDNESLTPSASYTLAKGAIANTASQVCTLGLIYNASNTLIASGNYSVSGCVLSNATQACTGCSPNAWKVSYTYTYKDGTGAGGVIANVSNGVIAFFGNTSTYFALLGVVVIILIISLVVVVVNRFGGEGMGGGQEPSL